MKVKSLAVLSMAAVSFLIGCNGDSDDKKFIDSINKVVEENKSNIVTCSDAAKYTSKAGYNIEKTFGGSNCLAFDTDSKCFVLMNNDDLKIGPKNYKLNSNKLHLFKITSNYDACSNYSQYLKKDFVGCDELYVSTGLDTGSNNNIKTIVYDNTYGEEKNIIVNAKCDYFEVTSPKDTIYHYGTTNNLFITANSSNCKFHEYGESAYIQASAGEFNLEKGCSTDIFEIPEGCSVTTTQNEDTYITGAINADNVLCRANIDIAEVSTADEIESAIKGNKKTFIRLVGDIQKTVKIPALEIERSIIIDLNGRSIEFVKNENKYVTDEFGVKYYYGIKLSNTNEKQDVTCIIMDSQSRVYTRSGIYLDDCSFVVEGQIEKTLTQSGSVDLHMNSGKIHAIRDKNSNSFAVLVLGNTENNKKRNPKPASYHMHGGFIKTEKGPEYTSSTNFKCLQARGSGAEIEMNYGDIESFNYCISGQGTNIPGGSTDVFERYGDTKITINGGNLIGGTDQLPESCVYTPLFFPSKCEVLIEDVYVNGPTCLDAKRGTITINGGKFEAWGNNPNGKPTSAGGSCADGSVIMAECNNDYAISDLTINVNNATMTSDHRYIANIPAYYNQEPSVIPYPGVELTFDNGTYTYYEDKVLVDSKLSGLEQVKYSITKNGNWINKKEA